MEITELSAAQLSESIHARDVSCREVMEAYLDRIDERNPALNAIVSLRDRDELMAEATECDDEIAHDLSRGWMHGMPQAIKDLAETKGLRTTKGSRLLERFVPNFDCLIVARMKDAGCIVVGKTNVPEFGLGSHTFNDVFGTTRNPYDTTGPPAAAAGAPRWRWPRACCRWPTAATTWARCATRPRGTTCSVSGPARDGSRACPSATTTSPSSAPRVRWLAPSSTSPCCWARRPDTTAGTPLSLSGRLDEFATVALGPSGTGTCHGGGPRRMARRSRRPPGDRAGHPRALCRRAGADGIVTRLRGRPHWARDLTGARLGRVAGVASRPGVGRHVAIDHRRRQAATS